MGNFNSQEELSGEVITSSQKQIMLAKSACEDSIPTIKKILSETREVTNWYSLGIQLEITPEDLNQIESNHSGDTERCKTEVVNFWLRNTQECTWDRLAQAVDEMGGHTNLVQTLRKNHQGNDIKAPVYNSCVARYTQGESPGSESVSQQSSYSHRSQPKPRQNKSETEGSSGYGSHFTVDSESEDASSPLATPVGCGCGKCSLYTLCSKGCSKPSGGAPLPIWNGTECTYPANSWQYSYESKLIDDTKEMSFKFASLVNHTVDSLKRVSLNRIVLWMKHLEAIKPVMKAMPLLGERMEEVSKAENVEQLFWILSDYWSWYNKDLLEKLMNEFGDREDQDRLREYNKEYTAFLKNRLPKSHDHFSFGAGHGKGQKPLLIKVDEIWEAISLGQIRGLHHNIAEILRVPPHVLYLSSVSKGCICLGFMVPSSMPDLLFPLSASQEKAFLAANAFRLECGDYIWQAPNFSETPDSEANVSGEGLCSDQGYDGSSESEGQSDSDHPRHAGNKPQRKRKAQGRRANGSSKLHFTTGETLSHLRNRWLLSIIPGVVFATIICLLVLGACGNPRIETTASLNENSWSTTPFQTAATDFIENSCPNTAVLLHPVPSWNVSAPPTSTAPPRSPTPTLSTSTGDIVSEPATPATVLPIIYYVIAIIGLLVLVGLSFCTLVYVLRICQRKGMTENRCIPRSVRRMISGSGTYHPSHDYEDIEAQLTLIDGASKEMPPEYFEGVYLRQNRVPSDSSSGLYAELPFYSDDNMSEFFEEQIYNLSTMSGDSSSTCYPTYLQNPNPFPHVTGSQQNLANSQTSLPVNENGTYSRLYRPSTRQSRACSNSRSPDHSGHSQQGYCSQQSHRSNQSGHSVYSQHSNQSHHSNHSQRINHSNCSNHSNHSHHSNCSNVAEPQIPPFPMNLSGQPPVPSHPPLEQRTSIPDEILLTGVSCLMHGQNCQFPHCPCKLVQERYRELYQQNPSYHPHQHAAESCNKECGPNTDPGERKHQLHLSLSSQNLTDDTHPHYHLTTKSHICRVMPEPPLIRQRSRSCDLTPNHEFDGFYSDPMYDDYKPPPFLREISISADNIPALCVNDCPLTPTPLSEFRGLISSPMHSRSRQWSLPKKTLKTSEEKQTSTESSETNESNTSSRSGSHECLASVSDSERHSERTGQKQTSSPIPPKSNGYKKVMLGESGYDSTIENTPPIPRWFNKVTSMGGSGYDSNNYDIESEGHSNPSSGKLPRKAQAMAHLQRQPNLVLNNNSVEVTETLC